MKTKILAALLFAATATPAFAETPTTPELDAAISQEHETSTRARYCAQETTIAERDIVTAMIERQTARAKWDLAVREGHPEAAGTWAKRHADAMTAEAEARARAQFYATERDDARAAFDASTVQVRRMTQQARRAAQHRS